MFWFVRLRSSFNRLPGAIAIMLFFNVWFAYSASAEFSVSDLNSIKAELSLLNKFSNDFNLGACAKNSLQKRISWRNYIYPVESLKYNGNRLRYTDNISGIKNESNFELYSFYYNNLANAAVQISRESAVVKGYNYHKKSQKFKRYQNDPIVRSRTMLSLLKFRIRLFTLQPTLRRRRELITELENVKEIFHSDLEMRKILTRYGVHELALKVSATLIFEYPKISAAFYSAFTPNASDHKSVLDNQFIELYETFQYSFGEVKPTEVFKANEIIRKNLLTLSGRCEKNEKSSEYYLKKQLEYITYYLVINFNVFNYFEFGDGVPLKLGEVYCMHLNEMLNSIFPYFRIEHRKMSWFWAAMYGKYIEDKCASVINNESFLAFPEFSSILQEVNINKKIGFPFDL